MEEIYEFINPFLMMNPEGSAEPPMEPKMMPERMSPLPENPVVAMAYIPYQNMNKVYDDEQGLDTGTMFPELNKPFLGRGGY